MNTVTVKSYTRQKPQKAPDPLQDDIDRRLSAKRAKANAGPDALTIIRRKLKVLASMLVQ